VVLVEHRSVGHSSTDPCLSIRCVLITQYMHDRSLGMEAGNSTAILSDEEWDNSGRSGDLGVQFRFLS
jgi:hypothetical protein